MRFQEYNISGLGPPYKIPIEGMPGFFVRISDINLECVVFIGFEDDSPGKGGIQSIGTGFLVEYDGYGYLVTAKHIARALEDAPFIIRVNKTDGTSINYPVDEVEWYYHADDNIDVAVIPFQITNPGHKRIYEVSYFGEAMLLGDEDIKQGFIGIGDQCYTIGLFRFMAGSNRNLPVVHTGNIALISGKEKVPVNDWDDPNNEKIRHIEAYLIE